MYIYACVCVFIILYYYCITSNHMLSCSARVYEREYGAWRLRPVRARRRRKRYWRVGRPAATTDFACVQRHGACDCAVTPARRFWRTRHAKPPRRATYATARTAATPSHRLSHVTEQAFACGLRIMHYNVCARVCTQWLCVYCTYSRACVCVCVYTLAGLNS
jgi:hypothetical protein